jgi:rhodanese-related sulfurtransferase
MLGFAKPDEVIAALNEEDTVVIDVRSEQEVKETGHLPHPRVLTTHCHECHHMEGMLAEKYAPDKNGR